MSEHVWYISAGSWGDGKSVCLWMQEGTVSTKIARFQSVEAARIFIKDFRFPVSDRVQDFLDKKSTNKNHLLVQSAFPPETRITVNGKTFFLADIKKEMAQ